MPRSQYPGRPPRLPCVFSNYHPPIYYITITSLKRRPLLANDSVHVAFRAFAEQGVTMRRAFTGRYMIMPDHIHLFASPARDTQLGRWVGQVKAAITRGLHEKGNEGDIWQPGFFDHLLRSAESYDEKWAYVRLNPVRAGLAHDPAAWPYQGEITPLEWS